MVQAPPAICFLHDLQFQIPIAPRLTESCTTSKKNKVCGMFGDKASEIVIRKYMVMRKCVKWKIYIYYIVLGILQILFRRTGKCT
jgi:hypothetical protein